VKALALFFFSNQEETRSTMSTTTNRLLTPDEAAAYLGISKLTMYEWISKRKIEYVKVGRLVKFRERTLEQWIEKHTVKPLNKAA
jgi:excisionase family DNA binding protein